MPGSHELDGFSSGIEAQSPALLPQYATPAPIPEHFFENSYPVAEMIGGAQNTPLSPGLSQAQLGELHTLEILAGRCIEFRGKTGNIPHGTYAWQNIPITPTMVCIWERALVNTLAGFADNPAAMAKAKVFMDRIDGSRRKEIKELNVLWSAGDESWNEETRILNTMWDNGTD